MNFASENQEEPQPIEQKPYSAKTLDSEVGNITKMPMSLLSNEPCLAMQFGVGRSRRTLNSLNVDGIADDKLPAHSRRNHHNTASLSDIYDVPRPAGLRVAKVKAPHHVLAQLMQLCHSCGKVLSHQEQCARCGHDFCYKCAPELRDDESRGTPDPEPKWHPARFDQGLGANNLNEGIRDLEDTLSYAQIEQTKQVGRYTLSSELPNPPTRSPRKNHILNAYGGGAVTTNPFFLADQLNMRKSPARQTTPTDAHIQTAKGFKGSTQDGEPLLEKWKVIQAKHSLCCSSHQNDYIHGLENGEGLSNDALQRKLDQLCRHAKDWHNSQHAMKHLTTALQRLDRHSGGMMRTVMDITADSTAAQSPVSQPALQHSIDGDENPESESRIYEGNSWRQEDADAASALGPELLVLNPEEANASHNSTAPQGLISERYVERELPNIKLSGPSETVTVDAQRRGNAVSEPERVYKADDNLSGDVNRVASEYSIHLSPDNSQMYARSIPEGQPNTASTGHDLPSLTGYKRHRQDTYLCPRAENSAGEPDLWPRLRKISEPFSKLATERLTTAPWSRHSLRRVSAALEPKQGESIPLSPKTWRESLKKTPNPSRSSHTVPTESLAVEWRRSPARTPRAQLDVSEKTPVTCESCNPAHPKSRQEDDDFPGSRKDHNDCAAEPWKADSTGMGLEDPFIEPRLSVRDIENSLVLKGAQGDFKQHGRNNDESPAQAVELSATVNEVNDMKQSATTSPATLPESCHSCS